MELPSRERGSVSCLQVLLPTAAAAATATSSSSCVRDDKARSATCGQLGDAAARALIAVVLMLEVEVVVVVGAVARRQAAFPTAAEATGAVNTKRRPLEGRERK